MQILKKKYPICTWKLSLNEGKYSIKIDGGRQKDRQTDKVSYRGAPFLKKKEQNHKQYNRKESKIKELR